MIRETVLSRNMDARSLQSSPARSRRALRAAALCGLLALLAGGPLLAQGAGAGLGSPPSPRRIVLLGASVTAGFGGVGADERGAVRLKDALELFWDRDDARLIDRSEVATFIDPVRQQTPRVQRAERDRPDLVLGVDFMFWFGYGRARSRSEALKDLERFEMQEEAFALIERFDCPVILGDYPDMRDADARILRPHLVPGEKTLAELNRRLRTWAADRNNVHVVPLSDWVASYKAPGMRLEYEGKVLQVEPYGLLQRDRLHATRLGSAVLALHLVDFLRPLFPRDWALRPRSLELPAVVRAVRAEPEVEDLMPTAGSGVGREK